MLYRIDLAARWHASRPADLAEAPKQPGVPPELVAHLAATVPPSN